MTRQTWLLPLILSTLLAGSRALADVLVMHDGRRVAGRVLDQPNPAVVRIETTFGVMEFKATEVARVEYGPVASPSPSPSPTPATRPESITIADRELLARTNAEADKCATAAEGLAIWLKFLKDLSAPAKDGSLARLAEERRVVWQQRVDRGQVRFGPTWQARTEVDKRIAKADELVATAAKAGPIDEAVRALDAAAVANPYRADIPFIKAKRLIDANRFPQAQAAFESVLIATPDHGAALNNVGVLLARDHNFARAIASLGRAAALMSDSDVPADNLDVAIMLARKAESKADVAAGERQVKALVDACHKAGKHISEIRWGNSWIANAEFEKLNAEWTRAESGQATNLIKRTRLEGDVVIAQKVLGDTERDFRKKMDDEGETPAVRDLATKVVTARARLRELNEQIRAVDKDTADLLAKRPAQPHANSFTLLEADGKGTMMTLPLNGSRAPDPKSDPKATPGASAP